jgi:hypothetical protein
MLDVAVVRDLRCVLIEKADVQVVLRECRSDLASFVENRLLSLTDTAGASEVKKILRKSCSLKVQVKAGFCTPHCLFEAGDFEFVFFGQLQRSHGNQRRPLARRPLWIDGLSSRRSNLNDNLPA